MDKIQQPMGHFLTTLIISALLSSATIAQNITIAVTVPPYQKWVEAIGHPYIKTLALIPPGTSDEVNEPSIQTLKGLSTAKAALLMNTLPIEKTLLPKLSRLNKNLIITKLAKNPLQDPHLWISPKTLIPQVSLITNLIIQSDPKNKEKYLQNSQIFLKKLTALDQQITQKLKKHSGKGFLILHPSLTQYAKDYNLKQFSLHNETHAPLTSRHMKEIIKIAQKNKIRVIIVEPNAENAAIVNLAKTIHATLIPFNPMSENYLDEILLLTNQLEKKL